MRPAYVLVMENMDWMDTQMQKDWEALLHMSRGRRFFEIWV